MTQCLGCFQNSETQSPVNLNLPCLGFARIRLDSVLADLHSLGCQTLGAALIHHQRYRNRRYFFPAERFQDCWDLLRKHLDCRVADQHPVVQNLRTALASPDFHSSIFLIVEPSRLRMRLQKVARRPRSNFHLYFLEPYR